MPAKPDQDFEVHEGSDFALMFEAEQVSEIDLSAVSAATWRMGLTRTPDGADVEKTLGSGITAVSGTSQVQATLGDTVDFLKVTVDAADTTGLGGTESTAYYHEIRVTNVSGATSVIAYGTGTILASNTG